MAVTVLLLAVWQPGMLGLEAWPWSRGQILLASALGCLASVFCRLFGPRSRPRTSGLDLSGLGLGLKMSGLINISELTSDTPCWKTCLVWPVAQLETISSDSSQGNQPGDCTDYSWWSAGRTLSLPAGTCAVAHLHLSSNKRSLWLAMLLVLTRLMGKKWTWNKNWKKWNKNSKSNK